MREHCAGDVRRGGRWKAAMKASAVALAAAAALYAAEPEPEPGSPPPKPEAALPAGGRIGSIAPLLKNAGVMARQWSPDAKLYAVLGSSPGNPSRYAPEHWEFFFGDPKTKDGVFRVVYEDGALRVRSGIKGGVQAVEQFDDGKLQGKQAAMSDWTTYDYKDCTPLAEPFLDSGKLDRKVRDVPIHPDELGRFRLVLLSPRNDNCDGLGHMSEFLPEKPIPKRMRGKTLWMVSGPDELVFFAGATGEPLLRRLKKAPEGPKSGAAGSKGP